MNKPPKKHCDWCKTLWSYKEILSIVLLLIVVGAVLQLTIGSFDYNVIRFPANVFLLAGVMFFVVFMTFHPKNPFFIWLSGVPLSLSTIGGLLLCSLIMGAIPQIASNQSGNLTGFESVTRSWSFVLVYLLAIINLSCVVSNKLRHFTWRDYTFYLSRVGLLVLLIAAGLSAADKQRFVMHVEEGTSECRVSDQDGAILELPVSIQLNDFYMEENVPKLAIIDSRKDHALPAEKSYWQIDTLKNSANIAGWNIQLNQYINEGVQTGENTYQQYSMPEACPVAFVNVENSQGKVRKSGWVSCGNFAQKPMKIVLNDTLNLIMTPPEPKLLRSDIVVFTKNGKIKPFMLEVNKPMRVGPWMIYQFGYDIQLGKASNYSSFELVYDPWFILAYIGIFLLFCGSICLLWQGTKKKKF